MVLFWTRTAIAREIGDIDPALTGDADWDWLLRIAKRYPIGAIEQPVLFFRQRVTVEESRRGAASRAMGRIFHRHTRSLSFLKQLKLRPIFWRHRGAWASGFLMCAQMNYASGDYKRAYRSLYYAFRCSPPHALLGCLRNWPFKSAQRSHKEPGAA